MVTAKALGHTPAADPHDEEASQTPPPKVSKRPPVDNPDPGIVMERLYGALVELEGIAVTADECTTMLPVILAPSGKHERTMKRLYKLVGATAGRASAVLERTEDMLALLSAARGGKRSPTRRAR